MWAVVFPYLGASVTNIKCLVNCGTVLGGMSIGHTYSVPDAMAASLVAGKLASYVPLPASAKQDGQPKHQMTAEVSAGLTTMNEARKASKSSGR